MQIGSTTMFEFTNKELALVSFKLELHFRAACFLNLHNYEASSLTQVSIYEDEV